MFHRIMTAHGSISGPYHIKNNIENQDYYNFVCSDNFCVYVLADGAGSLKNSRQGAEIVVEKVLFDCVQFLENNFEDIKNINLVELLKKCFIDAIEEILKLDGYKEYGSTLTAVIVTEYGWASATIGDSFSVIGLNQSSESFDEKVIEDIGDSKNFLKNEKIFDKDTEYKIITMESSKEYANLTDLTTSKNYVIYSDSGKGVPDFVALSSDGLQYVSLQQQKPFASFWGPLANNVKEHGEKIDLNDLFEKMRINGRLDDDTSLIISVFLS